MSTTEAMLEFPKLTGALGQLVDAITDDIPYSHRALTVLTYVGVALSGHVRLGSGDYENLQPRFYSCLIGPPRSGKSAAMKEVKRALKAGLGDVHVIRSIDSGPALVEALNEHPRILLLPDEGSGQFAKFKSGRAFGDILSLLEDNEAENVIKSGATVVNDAHFAMVLSATPGGFTEMWTGTKGASSGLQDRFVLSFSDKKMPDVPTGSDTFAVQRAADALKEILKNLPETIDLPDRKGDFTNGLKEGLDPNSVGAARALDMARRFALLLAACNHKSKIEANGEEIQLGREFMRYQKEMFDRFMPDDASTPVQRFENRIIRYFERVNDWRTERNVRNNIKPERSPGGLDAFQRAFANLTKNLTGDSGKYRHVGESGELIRGEREGRGGYLWKLNPDRTRDPHPTLPTAFIEWQTTKPKDLYRDPHPTLPTDVDGSSVPKKEE
jgi:hypothetical protein